MRFDRISGGIVLALIAVITGVLGISLIKADQWWMTALGFPFVSWSCAAWEKLWKRVVP